MNRRSFLAGASGMIAGQIAASPSAAAEAIPRPILRRSRLYDNASTSPKKTMVQDLFSWNDVTYCLYNNLPRRYWGIAATTPEGATLWHYHFPKGVYLSIGIQGKRILLQAMTYDPEGRIQQNCLLRLETGTDIQVLQSQENSFRSRVLFVDDSTLLQIDSGIVEVWRITGSAVQRTAVGTVTASSQLPHVNLVSKNTAALTGFDGTSISFTDMESGSVREYAITVPEILAAAASYQTNSDRLRGTPVVIPATGSDREGALYTLIHPSPISATRTAKFDSLGSGLPWSSLRSPSRNGPNSIAPLSLIVRTMEMGVVYSDGEVAWYSL